MQKTPGMPPSQRQQVRFILIAIILATLPCYCTGYLMVRLARLSGL